jgi:hypothetical protein
MQKLSRNSLGKNNKSCITFHQESKNIGFAFVLVFYDFLWSLQVSAKHMYYLRNRLSLRSLEIFVDSQPYPYFAQNTPKLSQTLQCGPWAGWPVRPAQFRRGQWPRPGGSGCGAVWWFPKLNLGVWPGRRFCRWWGSAALSRTGRGSDYSGEVGRVSGTVSTSRRVRGWRAPQWCKAADRALGSPRLPPMAPVGSLGRFGRVAGCASRRGEEAHTRDEKVGLHLCRRRAPGGNGRTDGLSSAADHSTERGLRCASVWVRLGEGPIWRTREGGVIGSR